MVIITQRITIINIRKPVTKNINEELQWFGKSLGLFNLRDKDKSMYRIFIELLKAAKTKNPLSSEELSIKLNLSRGTVVHHLNKLMSAGIVVKEKNKYSLRVENLRNLVEEIEKDIKRSTEDLKQIASDIDQWLGL